MSIGLRRALDVLSQRCELDLACYERAALHGRIQRRIARVAESDAAYAALLCSDPEEIDSLYRDVLVGVTEFFCDDGAYAALARELRALLKQADGELRVWVAGCATGEEAYSVAILLDEARSQLDWAGRIRLFATDVHQQVLKQAAEGVFPREALERISASRRQRYFSEGGGHARAADVLREMTIFVNHNVLTDAPFPELDLICCRNVLTYFQPAARERVLEQFRLALRPGGLLFLGPDEAHLRGRDSGFAPMRATSGLFARQAERRPRRSGGALADLRPRRRSAREIDGGDAWVTREPAHHAVYEALLERYMPATFVLDAHRRLITCYGGAEKLLAFDPAGRALPLVDLLEGPLRAAAADLLERYVRGGGGVHAVRVPCEEPPGPRPNGDGANGDGAHGDRANRDRASADGADADRANGDDGLRSRADPHGASWAYELAISPLGRAGAAPRPIVIEIRAGVSRDRG